MAVDKYWHLPAPTSESTDTPETLGPDEARRIRGLVAQGRTLVSAPGRVQVYAAPILSGKPILGMERFKLLGRKINRGVDTLEARTLAKCGAAVWLDVSADGSGDFRPVAARTEGAYECFTPYGAWMYCSNGSDAVVRLDGNFYAVGTAACAGGTATVSGTGTYWLDDTLADLSAECSIAPGDKLFFKVGDTWQLTPYTVAHITSNGQLELTANGPNTGGAVDYIIVRSHLAGIVMSQDDDNGTYEVQASGGSIDQGLYNYRYILSNLRTGVQSNASAEGPNVFCAATGRSIKITLPSSVGDADTQAPAVDVYRTKGVDGWADMPRDGGLATYANQPLNSGVRVVSTSASDNSTKSVEVVGTVHDASLGAAAPKVIEDCEGAWTYSAPVTSDTVTGKVGNARRVRVPSSFAVPGIAAYKTLAAPLDISGYNALAAWIRVGGTLAAGKFSIVLSENDDPANGVSEELLSPVMSGMVWYRVVIPFVGAAATRNAIKSVGLKIESALGYNPLDIYIDDIEAVVVGSSRVVRRELINLNGITAVPSAFTDWDQIIGYREYPTGQTWGGTVKLELNSGAYPVIDSFAAATAGQGVYDVSLTEYNGIPGFIAIDGAADTIKVGVRGTDKLGKEVYACSDIAIGQPRFASVELVSIDTLYYTAAQGQVALIPGQGTAKVYYHVATLSRDPATYLFPEYTDTASDYDLDELMPTADGREPPPILDTMGLSDQLYGKGVPGNLKRHYIAPLGDPEYWPLGRVGVTDYALGGYVDYPDEIAAIVSEAGAYQTAGLVGSPLLIILQGGECWRWFGNSRAFAFKLDPVAGRSFQNLGGLIVGLTTNGIVAIPSGTGQVMEVGERILELLPEAIDAPRVTSMASVASGQWRGRYFLAWPQSNASVNNQVMIYRADGSGGRFSGLVPEDVAVNFSGFGVWEDGELYASDGADGLIWRLFATTPAVAPDTGEFTYWLPATQGGMPGEVWFKNLTLSDDGAAGLYRHKDLDRIAFAFRCDTADQAVTIELYEDGADTPTKTSSPIAIKPRNNGTAYVIWRPAAVSSRVYSIRLTWTATRQIRYIWGQLKGHDEGDKEGT
jgi:hypothetical protein